MAADDPTKERFEILRRRAQQAARTATQQEREGLQRRFAAIGQIGSGAQIRAEAQAAERAAKRLQQAEETVGLAELAERQRQREIGEQRAFARGEREAGQTFAARQAGIGREFAAQQAGIGREFARGEREAGQTLATQQAREGREFARGERISSQEFATGEAEKGRDFTREQQALSRDLQEKALAFQRTAFDENIRQWESEFNRDTSTIEFNKKMALENASRTLLDDLGLGGVSMSGLATGPGGATTQAILRQLGNIDIRAPFRGSFGGIF